MLIAQDNPFGKITKEGPLFFLFGGGESGRGDYTPVNRDPKQTLVCGGGGEVKGENLMARKVFTGLTGELRDDCFSQVGGRDIKDTEEKLSHGTTLYQCTCISSTVFRRSVTLSIHRTR